MMPHLVIRSASTRLITHPGQPPPMPLQPGAPFLQIRRLHERKTDRRSMLCRELLLTVPCPLHAPSLGALASLLLAILPGTLAQDDRQPENLPSTEQPALESISAGVSRRPADDGIKPREAPPVISRYYRISGRRAGGMGLHSRTPRHLVFTGDRAKAARVRRHRHRERGFGDAAVEWYIA
jgi:hypothetical protein